MRWRGLFLLVLLGCVKNPQLSKQAMTQQYESKAVRIVVNGEGVVANDVEIKEDATIVRGETVTFYAQAKGSWFSVTCDPIGCDYYKMSGPPGVDVVATSSPTTNKVTSTPEASYSGITRTEPERDLPSYDKELDPNRAFQLAVALTMAPPGLGFIYGPSAGHFYAGEVGRGLAMSLLRGGLATIPFISAAQLASGDIERNQLLARDITAVLGISVLMLVDLLDASNAAKRANAKR